MTITNHAPVVDQTVAIRLCARRPNCRLGPGHSSGESDVSVFENWGAIKKARFIDSPTTSLVSQKKITSNQMIIYLMEVCGVSASTVRKVVDGFWEYVGDASKHRVQGSKRYLVIPHFGTFRRVAATSKGQPKQKLRFRSLPAPKLRRRLAASPGPSPVWVRRYQRAPDKAGTLSVRRRIAIHIADAKNIPLDEAYGLLCAMLDLCAHAFQQGRCTICWFGRGTMQRVAYGPDSHRYTFRQYPSVEFNGVHL